MPQLFTYYFSSSVTCNVFTIISKSMHGLQYSQHIAACVHAV